MSKSYKAPQAFDQGRPVAIALQPVESSQIKAVGYDVETKTLAVTFNYGKALYQYPNVEQATFDAFRTCDSAGKFFGQHIADLPFKKFHSETATA